MLTPVKVNYLIRRLAEHAIETGTPCEEMESAIRRQFLQMVLALTNGNQVHAAKAAGIHRNTLSKRLRDLNITVRRLK